MIVRKRTLYYYWYCLKYIIYDVSKVHHRFRIDDFLQKLYIFRLEYIQENLVISCHVVIYMQYLRKDVDNKKQNLNNCFLFKMIIMYCVKSEWRFWKKAKAECADSSNKTIWIFFSKLFFYAYRVSHIILDR